MHAHLFGYLLLALPLFCVGSLVLPEDLPRHQAVLLAICDAIANARLTVKEACALMHISETQWSRIQQGTAHTPSLTRLLLLPPPVWHQLLPALAWIVTRRYVAEIARDQQERKRA